VKAILIRASPKDDGIYASTVNDIAFVKNHMSQAIPSGLTFTVIDEEVPAKGMSMGEQILREVDRATRNNDHVLVYYTGHGDEHTGNLFLAGKPELSPKRFVDNWMRTGFERNKKLTLMVDACFSGNWIEAFAALPLAVRRTLRAEVFTASSADTTSTSANYNFTVGGRKIKAEPSTSCPIVNDEFEYRELQKIAKKLNLKANGCHEDLVDRINGSFSYAELQEMAREKGIPSGSAKEDLIERLDLSNQNDVGSGTQYLMTMTGKTKRFNTETHGQRPEYIRFGGLLEEDCYIAIQGAEGTAGKVGSVAKTMQNKVIDEYVSIRNDMAYLRKEAAKFGVSAALGGRSGGSKEDLVKRINKAAKKQEGVPAAATPPRTTAKVEELVEEQEYHDEEYDDDEENAEDDEEDVYLTCSSNVASGLKSDGTFDMRTKRGKELAAAAAAKNGAFPAPVTPQREARVQAVSSSPSSSGSGNSAAGTGYKKDGTFDMRTKKGKELAAAAANGGHAPVSSDSGVVISSGSANGKMLLTGARGGQYYITSGGKKQYVK
jgi:hypothetical protein